MVSIAKEGGNVHGRSGLCKIWAVKGWRRILEDNAGKEITNGISQGGGVALDDETCSQAGGMIALKYLFYPLLTFSFYKLGWRSWEKGNIINA